MADPVALLQAFAAGGAAVGAFVVVLLREVRRARRAEARAVEQLQAMPPAPVASDIRGPLVLLVEDDPIQRRLFARIVAPLGVRVVTAGSAEEAIQILHDRQFAVVVVDLGLPGLSGADIVARIRPRVLLLSGRDGDELRSIAELCGADAWLEKNGDAKDLCAAVARLIAAK